MNSALKRILFNIFFIVAILCLPWYLSLLVGILGTFFFPWFVEVIIAGIVFDILYGSLGASWFGLGMMGFFTSLIVFFALQKIKQNLR